GGLGGPRSPSLRSLRVVSQPDDVAPGVGELDSPARGYLERLGEQPHTAGVQFCGRIPRIRHLQPEPRRIARFPLGQITGADEESWLLRAEPEAGDSHAGNLELQGQAEPLAVKVESSVELADREH